MNKLRGFLLLFITLLLTTLWANNSINVNKNNPIQLNLSNSVGWDVNSGKTLPSTLNIDDSVITMMPSSEKDQVIDYKYTSLYFDGDKDYSIEFQVTGTVNDTITLQFISGDNTFHTKRFTLERSQQQLFLNIKNPSDTLDKGQLIISIDHHSNDSSIVLSDFLIEEIDREIGPDLSILFIGNSFTFYNDMPLMVKRIGEESGKFIHVESIAYSSYSLSKYLQPFSDAAIEVEERLKERTWDYVVLQEKSNGPYKQKDRFLISVKRLNELITKYNSQTVLFSTWSYRKESEKLASIGLDYDGFYEALTRAYEEAALQNDCLIAPVGTVFHRLTDEDSSIELLQDDDFHPSPEGSYITALIFYSLLTGDLVEGDNPFSLTKRELTLINKHISKAFENKELNKYK